MPFSQNKFPHTFICGMPVTIKCSVLQENKMHKNWTNKKG